MTTYRLVLKSGETTTNEKVTGLSELDKTSSVFFLMMKLSKAIKADLQTNSDEQANLLAEYKKLELQKTDKLDGLNCHLSLPIKMDIDDIFNATLMTIPINEQVAEQPSETPIKVTRWMKFMDWCDWIESLFVKNDVDRNGEEL